MIKYVVLNRKSLKYIPAWNLLKTMEWYDLRAIILRFFRQSVDGAWDKHTNRKQNLSTSQDRHLSFARALAEETGLYLPKKQALLTEALLTAVLSWVPDSPECWFPTY